MDYIKRKAHTNKWLAIQTKVIKPPDSNAHQGIRLNGEKVAPHLFSTQRSSLSNNGEYNQHHNDNNDHGGDYERRKQVLKSYKDN